MSEWTGLDWTGYPLDCYDYQSTCGAKKYLPISKQNKYGSNKKQHRSVMILTSDVVDQCQGLSVATAAASAAWARYATTNPHLLPLLTTMASSDPSVFLSFLLDPSTNHLSLALSQQLGNQIIDQLCYLTRTWLHTLHVARYRALGLWEYLQCNSSSSSRQFMFEISTPTQ